MYERREERAALHQGCDRGAVEADQQVALDVTRDGTFVRFGGALADEGCRRDVRSRLPSPPGAGLAQRASGAQVHDQLAFQATAALHVQRLVDRLV